MPAKARKDKMNPDEIEVHHVWSRCVGRAYLFGVDPLTGIDYSHRLEWLESAIEWFASVFAVEMGTYHLMSNHMHAILRNRPDLVQAWSDEEVVWRWKLAWPKYENKQWTREPTDAEIERLLQRGREQENYLPQLRRNLANISWHQARLKQSIALLANRESHKRGHHWEQRFGNRKLEDEADVVAGFLYNDLQQLRAGIVDSVEASDHSAIQRQIQVHARRAFADIHGREPQDGEDKDAQEVQHLETMFANCFLSPIESGGPLLTVPEQVVPASELVLPQGYLFEQEQKSQSPGGDAAEPTAPETNGQEGGQAEANEGTEDDDEQQGGTCQTAPARRGRGRPRRPRLHTIHRRLKRRQRRRVSRNSILEMPWSQYYDMLKQFERRVLSERQAGSQPPPITSPPGAVPDSYSPTNWRQNIREFGVWLQSMVAGLPRSLAVRLVPGPRGDPPAA